jgi:aminoglycoside phosphotransferase family enzyme
MKKAQILEIYENCRLPDTCDKKDFFETHISWVMLSDHFAFKIKRPASYSFLDFSTPDKRKFFCQQELKLNKRLAPEMYLAILPVYEDLEIGTSENNDGKKKVIDYAVQMKRMDNKLEMDRMLTQSRVNHSHLDKLATKLAGFHKKARVVKDPFNTMGFQENFADILSIEDYIRNEKGEKWITKLKKMVKISNAYLNSNRSYFNQRAITDKRRECHGDLKASNIFLYEDPVIFDCIEFNDDFRFIDVLNDIAFLCIEIEFYGNLQLSNYFYEKYLDESGMTEDSDSKKLFNYYKAYRANIKAKLLALKDRKNVKDDKTKKQIFQLIELLAGYCENLS